MFFWLSLNFLRDSWYCLDPTPSNLTRPLRKECTHVVTNPQMSIGPLQVRAYQSFLRQGFLILRATAYSTPLSC